VAPRIHHEDTKNTKKTRKRRLRGTPGDSGRCVGLDLLSFLLVLRVFVVNEGYEILRVAAGLVPQCFLKNRLK
jgi:hypothetical protein